MNKLMSLLTNTLSTYPLQGQFCFPNGDITTAPQRLREATISYGVPSLPGNYFTFAPYNENLLNANNLSVKIDGAKYVLVNVAKAGIKKSGALNLSQFIRERINNVGDNDIPRSILWTKFMKKYELSQFLFVWAVTMKRNSNTFDNCYLKEQEFYEIWKLHPKLRPHLNK